jgi:hypothetical protein
MIKHILNSILAWLFLLIKRQKSDYPDDLKDSTRQAYIDKIRKA